MAHREPYAPRPLDTSGLVLPPSLEPLIERLAEHNHDVWGWRWGPRRDDEQQEPPDLVPYAQLSPQEQEYDRNTAIEVIKAVLALGFDVVPRAAGGPAGQDRLGLSSAEAMAWLVWMRSEGSESLGELTAVWDARSPAWYEDSPKLFVELATRILRAGEPLMAYDVCAAALQRPGWDRSARLRHLAGLALASSGATLEARELALALEREGRCDAETLGLLARTHKDVAAQTADPGTREQELRSARDCYDRAYLREVSCGNRSAAYYAGINVAALCLLLGETDRAKSVALEVWEICEELRGSQGGGDYWLLATLGEAALIMGKLGEAEQRYGQAAEAARGRWREIGSTRRQARLLLQQLGLERDRFDALLRIPRVVVFVGHMVDDERRPSPRLDPSRLGPVRERLERLLERLEPGWGYASAACGADLLFLEAMRARGAELNLVLPFAREVFREASVEIGRGANWGDQFDKLCRAAATIYEVSDHRPADDALVFEFGNRVLYGQALLRARGLDTELVPVAVWDGCEGDGPGGTAATVDIWRKRGETVEVIDPAGGGRRVEPAPEIDDEIPISQGLRRKIAAILFADAVRYSELTELQIPLFVEHFLGSVADALSDAEQPPLIKNTWGDGLYLVFEDVGVAGRFALDLCRRLTSTSRRWTELGLPAGLALRVALHVGPTYEVIDPVTGSLNYTGWHVSRAARIEPVTPPGQVYASRQFAALAAATGAAGFVCNYVGQVPLPKQSGYFPLYHLRRVEG